jgi:hypothetical protein
MKQTDRQVKPTLNGHVRTQNLAFAPSGVRKYPYVRPARGTSVVKACLCQIQIKRIAAMAVSILNVEFASFSVLLKDEG